MPDQRSDVSPTEAVSPPATPTSTAQDLWSKWFWRAVQIVGLGIVVVQVGVAAGTSTRPDRPWVLLVAVAMMIGGFGMELLLRAALRIGGRE